MLNRIAEHCCFCFGTFQAVISFPYSFWPGAGKHNLLWSQHSQVMPSICLEREHLPFFWVLVLVFLSIISAFDSQSHFWPQQHHRFGAHHSWDDLDLLVAGIVYCMSLKSNKNPQKWVNIVNPGLHVKIMWRNCGYCSSCGDLSSWGSPNFTKLDLVGPTVRWKEASCCGDPQITEIRFWSTGIDSEGLCAASHHCWAMGHHMPSLNDPKTWKFDQIQRVPAMGGEYKPQ